MVYSFLVYLQLSMDSYLNLWKDLNKKKGYNTAMSMKDKKKLAF